MKFMVKSFNKASKISKAKKRVVEVLEEIQIAYDRELRYRLESEFPHDVVGLAISELEKETVIKRTNVPGRKGSGDTPNTFYRLPSSDYRSILPLMKRKLELAKAIQSVSSDMGDTQKKSGSTLLKRTDGKHIHPMLKILVVLGNLRARRLEMTSRRT